MAQVNINGDPHDTHYRYKMPMILGKIEGKGNGIKTVISNIVEIAKSINRPPEFPTKYFGFELGAQTKLDTKNDRYIVNGSHDNVKLQKLMFGFIKKYVLCSSCDNPETILYNSKQRIVQRCYACGGQNNIDMKPRLSTYILKNLSETSGKDKSYKKEEDNINLNNQDFDDKDSEDEWAKDNTENNEIISEIVDKTGNMKLDEFTKSTCERMDIFQKYLISFKNSTKPIDNFVNEIYDEAKQLDVVERCIVIIIEIFFNDQILTQIALYQKLLLKFVSENPKCERHLLGALEILIGKLYPDKLLKFVTRIFKNLYDLNILSEESILKWNKRMSKRYVSKEIALLMRKQATPLIDWLQNASEESSEEEEEESDQEEDVKKSSHIEHSKPRQIINIEEEFDIDDI